MALKNNKYTRWIAFLGCLCFFLRGHSAADFEFNKTIRALIAADDARAALFTRIPSPKLEYLCVSLGFNCTPALNLNQNKLRMWSFPFDWNQTSLRGLCDILDNNFIDFLNVKYLDRRAGIFNSKYNMAFTHDFPVVDRGDGIHVIVDNYLDYLEDIQTKYARRIERFNNVCNLAETVYFFRLRSSYWQFDTSAQDKNSVIKLRDALLRKFPTQNWVLIVIGTDRSYQRNWNIPQVKNFYMSSDAAENEWSGIFNKLGLR